MKPSLTIAGLLLLGQGLRAQPAAESVGPLRGRNAGGYNIVDWFETGYRFRSLGGDLGKYRSDVNFGNGLRLLGSSLAVYSREGQGSLFDALVLRTQGLGNDPYQFSSLHVEKNRLYRYDLLWRLDDYFNPALPIAGGRHAISTQRRFQDHDFTLFPQSRLRLFAGYTRNAQDGPALSTEQALDFQGEEIPLFAEVRRLRNEYRLGGEVTLFGAKFTLLHGWDNFSETTPYLQPGAVRRTEPYRGSSPYWRFHLSKEHKNWAALGRFTYTGGRRSFLFDESAVGANRFGAAQNRQIRVSGSGRRPVTAGNLTLSWFPAARLTVANQTSFHNTRMDGDGFYREVDNATLISELVNFQFLGIRAVTNTTDVTCRAANWLGVVGGYHYSTRRIRSVVGQQFFGTTEADRAEQDNRIHAGLAGLRLQPVKPLRLNLDAEVGRADRPFFPISERNYQALGARLQYKGKSLLVSAAARSSYNTNSVSLSFHSARGRTYALDASWTPKDWFALAAGYSKIHLDTLSGIAYFASGALVTGDRSIYLSNIHAAHLTGHFNLGQRVGLSLGYSRVQDAASPLTFETPLARLSVKLREKLRWNAGYQYYRYAEEFLPAQNYRAHTGYTSLLWSF